MSIIPTSFRRGQTQPAATDCWMCDPAKDGAMCAAHTSQVCATATAQSKPGYGRRAA